MKDDTKKALEEELKVLEAEALMSMSDEDFDPWYEDEIELALFTNNLFTILQNK